MRSYIQEFISLDILSGEKKKKRERKNFRYSRGPDKGQWDNYFTHLLSYPNTAYKSFSSAYGQQEPHTHSQAARGLTKLFGGYGSKYAPTESHFHRGWALYSKVVLVTQTGSALSSKPGLIFTTSFRSSTLEILVLVSFVLIQETFLPTSVNLIMYPGLLT